MIVLVEIFSLLFSKSDKDCLNPSKKLITERYWKHPAFVEALQLERCCEQLEMEMAQILLPFANLASEIMNNMKGRLRAVTVVNNNATAGQDDEESSSSAGTYNDPVRALLRWQDVPFMRELLRVRNIAHTNIDDLRACSKQSATIITFYTET